MIEQLITQYAQSEFDLGDDAAVVAILNDQSIVNYDSDNWTWKGIELTCGAVETGKLYNFLQANKPWIAAQLVDGLPMNDPMVRSEIAALTAGGVANLQPLLDATMQTRSPAQQALGRDVTVEDIQQARVAIAARAAYEVIRSARLRWEGVAASIRSQIESGSLTESGIPAAVSAIYGGA